MSSHAHAQEYGAAARAERPVAARNEEDATAAGIELDLRDRPVALESAADLMREVPGANPQISGAYGSFGSVSLRGSQLGHTIWVLGEVPLNTPDSGAFDMSTLPLPMLSSMQVFRGGAPAWYSQGAIGGVIRVEPARAEQSAVSVSAGGGSFGRYDLRASSQASHPGVRLFTGVGVTHARNDFPHLDPDLQSDDSDSVSRRVRNAQVTDGSGIVHLEADAGPGRIDVVLLGVERTSGIPGIEGAYNTKYTTRSYLRGFGSVAYTQERHAGERRIARLQLLGSTRVEHNRFQDPLGEFGLGGRPADRELLWKRGTLRGAASYSPLPWVEATFIGTFSSDHVISSERANRPPSVRHAETVSSELRFMGKLRSARVELRGSARLEWSQARVETEIAGQDVTLRDRLLSPTYRVAGFVEPLQGMTLRASWATGQRLPSVLELFGDGGFLRGNGQVAPERGQSADLGFVWTGCTSWLSGSLELAGFVQRVDDIIVWRNTSQFEYVALNQDRALIPGLELGFDGHVGRHLRITGAGTLLQSQNLDTGRQLPRRPRMRAFLRPEASAFFDTAALHTVTLYGSVEYQSTFFRDPANTALEPYRTLLGLGSAMRGFDDRLTLMLRVENLLDVRAQDFFRLPLPGRAFAVMATYQQEI